MNHQTLIDYANAHVPEMLQVIEQLVIQETPSHDKARLDAFADYLAGRFRQAGAEVEIIPRTEVGNHVRARFGYTGGDQPPHALILCHYDTVWPVGSLETHPFRIEEGKAYGPGIFDMQSSLMLSEYALRAVQDLQLDLPRPVTILMTSDEEIGSHHSKALITEEARGAAYALVMESPLPGGVLKTTRKGGGNFKIQVTGRAAHAGVEPEKGVSAILEMARQVVAIQSLADPAQETTVSVGTIQGGTATNVIPAHCTATVDLRAWTQAEMDRVTEAIRSLEAMYPEAQIEVSGGPNRTPLERTVTGEIFGRAQGIGATLGLSLQEGGTGGGSDASWPAALGIPTLDGLGVPGHGAHADHEHIEVDQIAGRAALLVALLMEL